MRYRAASRCPRDRFWHSAPEAPLWWMFHVTWSMRPGKSNLGQEGRLGKICCSTAAPGGGWPSQGSQTSFMLSY